MPVRLTAAATVARHVGVAAEEMAAASTAPAPSEDPPEGLSSPPPSVPHPLLWPCMEVGNKRCPAAETAVLLVMVICLVLLRDSRVEVVPGAVSRPGLIPLDDFWLRVHKR